MVNHACVAPYQVWPILDTNDLLHGSLTYCETYQILRATFFVQMEIGEICVIVQINMPKTRLGLGERMVNHA